MHMHMHAHMHMHMHTHTHMHTHDMHTHVHMHTHTHMHTHVHMHMPGAGPRAAAPAADLSLRRALLGRVTMIHISELACNPMYPGCNPKSVHVPRYKIHISELASAERTKLWKSAKPKGPKGHKGSSVHLARRQGVRQGGVAPHHLPVRGHTFQRVRPPHPP